MKKLWVPVLGLAMVAGCSVASPPKEDRLSFIRNRGINPVEVTESGGELHFRIDSGDKRCKGKLVWGYYGDHYLYVYPPGVETSEHLGEFQGEQIRSVNTDVRTRDCFTKEKTEAGESK